MGFLNWNIYKFPKKVFHEMNGDGWSLQEMLDSLCACVCITKVFGDKLAIVE
jgi:hypothetical protein